MAGSADVASADLRRWFSRCSRAAIRVLAAAATLSSTARACCLLPRLRDSKKARSSPDTTWATIRDAAGVPSTSLVWPSNWGSGSRTAITAVSPSSMSSLVTGSSPFFSSRTARSCSFSVRTRARSKPATWVPPLGVAITFTKDLVTLVVAAVPAQGHVHGQVALHVGGEHVPLVVQHRHGLGELAGADQPHHVGDRLARGQVGAELADPAREPGTRPPGGPSWAAARLVWPGSPPSAATRFQASDALTRSASARSSEILMVRPGTRYAVCLARWARASKLQAAPRTNTC